MLCVCMLYRNHLINGVILMGTTFYRDQIAFPRESQRVNEKVLAEAVHILPGHISSYPSLSSCSSFLHTA